MGGPVHRSGNSRRADVARNTRNSRTVGVCQCVGADSRTDLADDLPDDAQSGLPKRPQRRAAAERHHSYLRNELAYQALRDVRHRVAVLLRGVPGVDSRFAGR